MLRFLNKIENYCFAKKYIRYERNVLNKIILFNPIFLYEVERFDKK